MKFLLLLFWLLTVVFFSSVTFVQAVKTAYDFLENYEFKYYYADYVSVGNRQIDIREFMEITKVNLEDYKNKIVNAETVKHEQYYSKEKNSIRLEFSNGTSRMLNDTIHEGEYQPASHYELFKNNNMSKQYLIYNSYFEDSYFYLLDKETGDTTYKFEDYPFISPHKKSAISLKTPYSFENATATLEITKIINDKFSHFLSINFINWNIPNTKHIYWLSDDEFIISVKEVESAFSDERDSKYFYLKFQLRY